MMSDSVLLIDKPKGMTSHDVVDEVRRVTGERRVGHAGTLDPMATGLLIVLVGREATKRQAEFMGLEKEYEAEITFGAVSDTYDGEGKIVVGCSVGSAPPRERVRIPQSQTLYGVKSLTLFLRTLGNCRGPTQDGRLLVVSNLGEEDVKEALGEFIGVIKQKVPPYAAVKVGGKKLYEYARAGELDEVEIPVREVEVKQFELLNFLPRTTARPASRSGAGESRECKPVVWGKPVQDGGLPRARVRVVCSKGTYIRSLAHDLGQKLGVGAYLSVLRRTRIGPYRVGDAVGLEELQAMTKQIPSSKHQAPNKYQ